MELFNSLKEFYDMAKSNGAYERLDPESQRYMDKVIKDYIAGGVHLSEEKRKDIRRLTSEISTLGKSALDNIKDDPTMFEISELDLVGIGKARINDLEKVSGKPGWRKFPLKSPMTGSVLRLCENVEVKKKLQ